MKKLNKLCLSFSLFLVFCLMANIQAFSTHIVGYDMCMISLGNNQYKFRFVGYKDRRGAADLANAYTFDIKRNSDNGTAMSVQVVRIRNENVIYDPADCPPPGADLVLAKYTYESAVVNLSALTSPQGYYVVDDDCCRNEDIDNLVDPLSIGITYVMEIPPVGLANFSGNSSPEFRKAPLAFFCVGKPYTLDWNVVDPDGDNLVFSLTEPLDADPEKPFTPAEFAPGYNLFYNVMDGAPDLTVNPTTGKINFIPTRIGTYVVSILCEEFRNGVKIGEVRREYQLETVLCPEAPPVTEDNNNQKRNIVDTLGIDEELVIKFTSRDSPNDKLEMFILIDPNPNENLLNPNTLQGKWGEPGSLLGDPAASDLVIEGLGLVQGEFRWKPRCEHVRNAPYKFIVVVKDQTCPSPFYDSTFVSLYVRKEDNIAPYFILPDTIKSQNTNETVLQYFVNAGELFQLSGDSILRTYDQDSTQLVTISCVPDPLNDTINSKYLFSPNPGLINSSAVFRFQTQCSYQRDEPYRWEFVATDNDCKAPISARFTILVYIKDRPNLKPEYAEIPSTFSVPEGNTRSFDILILDTARNAINNYKNITIYPDLSDFASVNGGAMPIIDTTSSLDSLRIKFTWTPVCANVRIEPYTLRLRAADEGCPVISNYAEVQIFATGPFNSAPEFRDEDDNKYNVVNASIYGGDEYVYDLYAVDTNQRFDSVFIALDQSSEIANPNIVENVAELIPGIGKDSARTVLRWRSDCFDIRATPYKVYVIASDNECVNPERDTLVINILVNERPNFVPEFTPSTLSNLLPTYRLPATTILEIPIAAFDTLNPELVIVDTVFTTIPFNLPKPEIVRTSGNGSDTVRTTLRWTLDCSLIRPEPYIIKIGAWDEACRNPQDSARYTFQVFVEKNPLLNPVFNIAQDTSIEVVAGENFELELISASFNPGDSIRISTEGDVYGGIPGNLAVFEQTEFQGIAKGVFKWTTGCDQISETIYKAKFVTANYPCQSDLDTLTISFKVIPNTDVTNEIPNVFTPNGDDKNDTYSIINQYKVYCDPGFKFSIFNRWGKKVFESVDPAFVWEPESSIPAGTYFFTLESRARTQTGTIEIVK